MDRVRQLLEKFGAVIHDGVLVASGNLDAARAALAELDHDELLTLTLEIARATEGVDSASLSGSDVAALKALSDVAKTLRDETNSRPEPPPEEQASDILSRLRAGTDAPAQDSGESSEPDGLAATGTPARQPARVPASHRPRTTAAPRTRIRRPGGSDYESLAAAAGDFGRIVENAVRGTTRLREGEQVSAVQLDWSATYPEDRHLRGNDLETTSERMLDHRDALLASGGVSGPPTPRYNELVFGQVDRPIRDGLPSFLATRGTIVWNPPPTLDDVVIANPMGAVGVVTNAMDLSGTTKGIQDVANPTNSTAVVRAIYIRMQFSNFSTKFLPERMASLMKLGTVAHARECERNLLVDIKNASTKWTDLSAGFGAYRTLKPQVLAVVEELRDHLRDDSVPITAIFPDFLPALLATDITRQQPGDAAFDATVARMKADVASWGVQPVWADESIRGRLLSTPAGGARSPSFDADVEWACFPSGTWLYLDGGQLDLGIVRDSTLNATNKLQTFFENWEALAQLGPYSYWITSSLCADGAAQAASAINVCSPSGS